MKKLFISASALALGASTFVSAQSLPSIAELLQDAKFWYGVASQLDVISVDEITTSTITLKSPIILDAFGDNTPSYIITYSPYLLENLAQTSNQTILNEVKSKEIELKSWDKEIILLLWTQDGLDKDTIYYATVTPQNYWDDFGVSSEQICFKLSAEEYEIGDACSTFKNKFNVVQTTALNTTNDTHSAAGSTDMTLANVTHTINNNTVTLRWTAIAGADQVDIFLFNTSQEKFVRLGTARMSDERFDYTMTWDGEHIFRFVPLDGGKEIVYNINAMRTQEKETTPTPTPTPPVIEKVPQTGPVENTIAILIISLLVYRGYRYYTRKSY